MKVKKSTKILLLGAGGLLVAAGSGAIGASTTTDLDGNNRVLSGSDVFKAFSNDLISQFSFGHDNLITTVDATRTPRNPGAGPDTNGNSTDGTYYTGGGSGVGESALTANTQQIAVETNALKTSSYAYSAGTGTAAGSVGWINADGDTTTNGANSGSAAGGRELPIQGTSEALIFALDGLEVLANTAQAAATTPNGVVVQGAQLTVHHYVPSDARPFAAAGLGGSAVASTKTWVLPGVTFLATDVGAKIAVSGATNAGNNNIFTIATVTPATNTITTVQAPVNETFASTVNFTVFASRIYVVNDSDTAYPNTAYGAVSGVYTFNNSLDVLRVLYGGLHHDGPKNGSTDSEQGTFDAGSDVRRSLADNFGKIFSGAVVTPSGQLTHAWRRSDLSGTANAFIALVNFGARGLGAISGTSTKTNPFANAGDANGLNATTHQPVQFPLNSTVKSNEGPGDFSDDDPIRRPAQIGPNPATTSTANVDLEQVAENDGTLGLVLTVFPPDALDGAVPTVDPAYASGTVASPSPKACTTGKFDLLSPGFLPTGPTGTSPAPEGGPFSGLVFIPYFLDTTVTPNVKHYNCVAKSTNLHPFGAPTPADNRVWNLAVRSDTDGHFYKDLNQRFLGRDGFYRIHTTISNALVVPQPSTGPADVVAKSLVADAQSGLLVVADPLSIAFTGRGVDVGNPLVSGLSLSGQASLGTPGQFDPTQATFATDQNVKNLVIGGATPVYPLARRLLVNTLVGFTENPPWSRAGILAATGHDIGSAGTFDITAHAFVPPVFSWNGSAVVGASTSTDLGANTAVRGLQGQEAQIAAAFQNSDHVGALASYWGFVPLPSLAEGYTTDLQGHPAGGVTAVDYPEDQPATAFPLPGGADTSNRYASLHAISATAFPNANNEDATVVSPGGAYTPYSLNGSAPPFPYDTTREPAHLPWPGSTP